MLTRVKPFRLPACSYGIVVTAVAPGFVATSANLQTLAGPDGAAIKGASSWGRVALPEEVAEVVAFAAAWNRCAAISGAVLDVNGASYVH